MLSSQSWLCIAFVMSFFPCRNAEEVVVSDVSLQDYIGIKGKYNIYLPHTAGRYQKKAFRKVSCPIVERLVNSLMFHGRNNGKKL